MPPKDAREQELFDKANCLTAPLMFVMVLVVLFVWALGLEEKGSDPFVAELFRPSADDSLGTRAVKGLGYAAAIQCAIIVATLGFVALLHFRMERGILALSMAAYVLALVALPSYLLVRGFEAAMVPVDAFTFAVVLWNYSVAGALCILSEPQSRLGRRTSNLLLLLVSVGMAWPFCCLPELALWFLVLLMIVWDLFAVLTPCGPLRYAMNLDQKRRYLAQDFRMPAGMVYEAQLYSLGLMDLVFYGVVVGRAAIIDWPCTVSCMCAVVAGLVLTIAVTPPDVTIPALPITLALGVAVYFGTRFYALDFVNYTGSGLISL